MKQSQKDPSIPEKLLQSIQDRLLYYRDLGIQEVYSKKGEAVASKSKSKETLEGIRADIGECTRCKLHLKRTHIVFGEGNPKAELMFVGEGPGHDEDVTGRPFVGRAGQLLTKIIEAMKLKRQDVYIANIVKCLRYNALVQLGDGSWERIGRLVRSRYSGEVMSVDSDGRIVPKRVVGWHTSPLAGRQVFRLTYRSAKNAGASRVGIQLTGDHPVLTEKGYVPVEQLTSGCRIATGQGLSSVAFDVVIGSLLGDGHINKSSSHLSIAHSQLQSEYLYFKANLLQELKPMTEELRVAAGGEMLYPVVRFRTAAHRALRILRKEFYQEKKRVPEWIVEKLNERMLAIWFMDDGYIRIRKNRSPRAEIATCGFADADILLLLRALNHLGITAKALRGRIHFGVEATHLLSEKIAPFIPGSMRYKLHPDVRNTVPFNDTLMIPDKPKVFFDEVEVEELLFKGVDRTFYCIDVEETHNFVTAGGVVHNCRPPNNRAPEPDEVATCEGFLHRQIAAIQPKVIVCLGSVATQNLLKTERKISSFRGQWQEWRDIAVMPTYHPAFLLRNPAMKKEVWEDMKKVMELLKKGGKK